MSLHEVLRDWKFPQPFKSTEIPRHTKAVLQKLHSWFGQPEPVQSPHMDLNLLYEALEQAARRNSILDATVSDLKWAPWVLFTHPKTAPGRLAADRVVLQDYLTWAGNRARPRQLCSLLYNFLKTYPDSLPTFHFLRQNLDKLLAQHSTEQGKAIWERCRRYALLDNDGPATFAVLLTESNRPLDSLMEDAGFDSLLETGRFMALAYARLLQRITATPSGQTQASLMQRVLEISARPSGREQEGPRFGQGKALAEALLLPFAQGEGPADLTDRIKTFLMQHLGDPRFVSQTWQSVTDQARNIILSWLVKAALEDFFEILSTTADEIWEDRRDFWSAYLNRGYIQEAWVILGTNAFKRARHHFHGGVTHARLAGAYSNQSVLLMRINGLIIAEWSHNGKCRIWNQRESQDKRAGVPQLYLKEYRAEELRTAADFEQVHGGSNRATWQRKVHDYIRGRTNISLRTTDYFRG